MTDEVLDEIVDARLAGFSWPTVADALAHVHGIRVSPDWLRRWIPTFRPEAR